MPDVPDAGLNAGLRGTAPAGRRAGRAGVAALTADLPALRPAELAAALRGGGRRRAVRRFVADAAGTGTVLLAAPAGVPLDPLRRRLGRGARRERARCALTGDWPGLRRDVDTAADLADGARARARPAHRGAAWLGARRLRRPDRGPRYVRGMQGTVATFDAQTRSGTLLLDDGTELAFPAAAFDASGLRLLRLGQRVRVERPTPAGDGGPGRRLPTMA